MEEVSIHSLKLVIKDRPKYFSFSSLQLQGRVNWWWMSSTWL
jgi:hypothetical protein